MRIAINGLSARFGGGAVYLRNIVENLAKLDRENHYMVFVCPEQFDNFASQAGTPNFRIVSPKFPGRAVIRRSIWEQVVMPALLRKYRIDLLFSPAGIAPIFMSDSCKQVNMVQNMAPFSDELLASYPSGRRKMRFLILRKLYPFFAARADANIFISKAGRGKLNGLADLSDKNSAVIYHGKGEIFKPVAQDAALSFVQEHYNLNEGFILYVSGISRYKNHLEVVRVYHTVREKAKQGGNIAKIGKLVFVGATVEPSYHRETAALSGKLGLEGKIVYTGQVPQFHLPYLYSAASVFVFASVCENCPNVLIEAMACGASIISSNSAPMPEICGDGALYFNPSRADEMADRIWEVLNDEALRQNLSEKAQENAERFSWSEAARRTLELFKTVSGRGQWHTDLTDATDKRG